VKDVFVDVRKVAFYGPHITKVFCYVWLLLVGELGNMSERGKGNKFILVLIMPFLYPFLLYRINFCLFFQCMVHTTSQMPLF
jgi:hypothetical protein